MPELIGKNHDLILKNFIEKGERTIQDPMMVYGVDD